MLAAYRLPNVAAPATTRFTFGVRRSTTPPCDGGAGGGAGGWASALHVHAHEATAAAARTRPFMQHLLRWNIVTSRSRSNRARSTPRPVRLLLDRRGADPLVSERHRERSSSV